MSLLSRKFWPLVFSLGSGAMTLAFYVLIVHRYGVGKRSDLVFALAVLPNVLYTATFGQLNEILVPYFVGRQQPELRATAFWNISATVAVFGTMLGALLFFPMAKLAPVLFHGATQDWPASLLGDLLTCATVYNLVLSLLVVKNSYLASLGHAGYMQSTVMLGNLGSVLWLWRAGRADAPLQILVAQLAGAMFALLYPAAPRQFGFYVPGYWSQDLRDAWVRVRWLILNAVVSRTEPLFDSILAGLIGTGAITVYYLFQRVVGFSLAVVQNGYILPFTKEASELARRAPRELPRALRAGAWISCGVSLALLLASAAGLTLMRFVPVPALHAYANVFRQHALVFYLLLGYGVFTLTAKTYATGLFVLRREWLFTILSVASCFLIVGMKVFASGRWGLRGLALSSSLGTFAYAGALALGFLRSARQRIDASPASCRVTRGLKATAQ